MAAKLRAIILILSVIGFSSAVKLSIFHFNDIDSQLQPFKNGIDPHVGGIASLIGEIKHEENKLAAGDVSIRLATANLVGGQSGWLSVLGWETFGELLSSAYKPTIMGLGLREFESDLKRTNAYLQGLNFSISQLPIISNIDPSSCNTGDEKVFCESVHTYSILRVDNVNKLGIVGFVNPTVMKLSDPGNLEFKNITESLKEIFDSDVFKDVKTVIAIGSGSIAIAKDIIDKVNDPKLKAVIFGGIEHDMTEKYPQDYGGKYIATAQKFGESFGKLVMDFASGEGVIDVGESKLIPVKPSGETDVEVANIVNALSDVVVKDTENLGSTLVKLDGTKEACWTSECNLGNLVADAMVHCAVNNLTADDNLAGVVAVWHSGAIFDDLIVPKSKINTLDVHKWLPYHNLAYYVTMNGTIFKEMFKTSGSAILAPEGGRKVWGQFLQVSNGIQVTYSTSGDLVSLRTMHLNDSKPILEDVKDDQEYHIVIPSILYKGKSVYDYFPSGIIGRPTSLGFDDDCLSNYIHAMGVLKNGFEERVFITDDITPTTPSGSTTTTVSPCPPPPPQEECSSGTFLTVVLTLVILALIVGVVLVGWKIVWPRIQQRRNNSFP